MRKIGFVWLSCNNNILSFIRVVNSYSTALLTVHSRGNQFDYSLYIFIIVLNVSCETMGYRIPETSHGCHGVSNHRKHDYLLDYFFGLTYKHQIAASIAKYSPYNGLVMRKAFPCHNIVKHNKYSIIQE